MLDGKRIVLGVTGGIAAYKSVELCRLFIKYGAQVRVVMTAAALEFVTPLTFQTVSGNQVFTDLFAATGRYNVDHIGLADEADLFVIAPATANCLGKVAAGIADDLLTTAIMAASCPVLFAPAMNARMYENPITRGNIEKLASLGYLFVGPEEGKLACGDSGRGRMSDPKSVLAAAQAALSRKQKWLGKRFLVTAGPTREALDPVRFLSNYSSGKMGYALAAAAAAQGATVTLVSGPTALKPPAGVEMVHVLSALEMYDAVLARYSQADVVIKAAAVADYRPAEQSSQKIKKGKDMTLTLVRNPDILAELGRRKEGQILVGFAAETEAVREHAVDKLQRKNLDLIVANDLTREGSGFGTDTNEVLLIFRDGEENKLPLLPKGEVAAAVLDELYRKFLQES